MSCGKTQKLSQNRTCCEYHVVQSAEASLGPKRTRVRPWSHSPSIIYSRLISHCFIMEDMVLHPESFQYQYKKWL